MPRRRNPRKNKRNNVSSVASPRELPATALRYLGPIVPPSTISQRTTYTTSLHGNQQMTSSAAGVLSGVLSLRNPSTSSGWGNLVAVFDEFRVLSAEFKWVPFNTYNSTIAQATPPFLTFFDLDTAVVPTTTTIAQSYGSCMMNNLSITFKRTYRMDSPEEASFVNTSVPTNAKVGSLGFITAQNCANNQTYGFWFFTYNVQFRGLIT